MPACALLLGGVVPGSAAAAWWRRRVVWRGTRHGRGDVRAGCLRAEDLPASGAAGWPEPGVRGGPARGIQAGATTSAR